MTTLPAQAALELDADDVRDSFDRTPFGFAHNLHELDLFSFESLRALAELYRGRARESYVTTSAPSPDAVFYSVPAADCQAGEALDRLESGSFRVLLKRPEQRDARFRALIDTLFGQVVAARGGLRGATVVRLESTILISSSATTTPFHFDPEIGFFAQIEGAKTYHLYPPAILNEPELELFYRRNTVDIGQVELQARDPSREFVFNLGPGKGLHQPQDAPHWVETRGSRSISYSFVYETDVSRARGRARCCNYYMRKLGLQPARPGRRPAVDALKAYAMSAVLPVRAALGRQ